jgi:hypothetical protein
LHLHATALDYLAQSDSLARLKAHRAAWLERNALLGYLRYRFAIFAQKGRAVSDPPDA